MKNYSIEWREKVGTVSRYRIFRECESKSEALKVAQEFVEKYHKRQDGKVPHMFGVTITVAK